MQDSLCYRLFTIECGNIRDGAEIKTKILNGSEIPVIMIGDKEFIRIKTTANIKGRTLVSAKIKRNKSGEIEFVPEEGTTDEFAIVVLKTELGGESGNDHTGDCIGWQCEGCGFFDEGSSKKKPDNCPKCGRGWHSLFGGYSRQRPVYKFASFPGKIIASEYIVRTHRFDGTFWAKGEHLVAIIPKGDVFRVHYPDVFHRRTSDAYEWTGRIIRCIKDI